MNKTFVLTALVTVLSTTAHADTMAQSAKPATTQPSVAVPITPQVPAVIDCKYHIPADTKSIDDATLSSWVSKAAIQSFNFNPASIDQELTDLKLCYTDAGWLGFNDALQKSGNINAIKTQHLTVSSQTDGNIKLSSLKDNQWKATVPLQVVYQNDKQKITQLLDIEVLVGRKPAGDLGILQMIATPRPTVTAPPPAEPVAAPAEPKAAPAPEAAQRSPQTVATPEPAPLVTH